MYDWLIAWCTKSQAKYNLRVLVVPYEADSCIALHALHGLAAPISPDSDVLVG